MRTKKYAAGILTAILTVSAFGSCFAAEQIVPNSGDSHPIYFDESTYRQASSGELSGTFTEKYLNDLAKPSEDARLATEADVTSVRKQMGLPEELYLLPLTEKNFRKMPDADKKAFISKNYKEFMDKTNKLIQANTNPAGRRFIGASQRLVFDYVKNDHNRADGKASVVEYMNLHVSQISQASDSVRAVPAETRDDGVLDMLDM